VEIRAAQKLVWENKLAKDFNTTDVSLEFALTHAEVSEAFEAYRKNPNHLGEELADVLLYVASIAEMTGIDLDTAVEAKIAKNARRAYRRNSKGVLVKTPATVNAEAEKNEI
jgi:NTP pyrophosphatase (non-canonical NTP hydrolase)